MSKEYWQQEYHWHKQVESGLDNYETRKTMDKTKVAKMDMEAFRQLKEAEYERQKWCDVAGIMHQYLVEGNPEGAVRAYEQAAWG